MSAIREIEIMNKIQFRYQEWRVIRGKSDFSNNREPFQEVR